MEFVVLRDLAAESVHFRAKGFPFNVDIFTVFL